MFVYFALCLSVLASSVSSNEVVTVTKYETRITFDLQLMPAMTLGVHHADTCTDHNTFEYKNASGHIVSNECSSYMHGHENSLRCDYDFGACDACPCSCQNSFCQSFECGDGVINGKEECDLGRQDDLQDMIDPDGCSNECTIQCGWTCTAKCQADWLECDSVYQQSVNGSLKVETCDRIAAVCGDGLLNPHVEECDDGNRVTGDGCDATCMLENNDPYYECVHVDHNSSVCPGLITVCRRKLCTYLAEIQVDVDASPSMFSPDDPYFIIPGANTIQAGVEILVTDPELSRDMKQIIVVSRHGHIFTCIGHKIIRYVSMDNTYTKQVVSGSDDFGYDFRSGSDARFTAPNEIALVLNETALVVCDQNQSVLRLVDLTFDPVTHSVILQNSGFVKGLAADPSGSFVVFYMYKMQESTPIDGMLQRYDLVSKTFSTLAVGIYGSNGLVFSGNGKYLFAIESRTPHSEKVLVAYETENMTQIYALDKSTKSYAEQDHAYIYCSHTLPGSCIVNSRMTSDIIHAPCLATLPTLRRKTMCGDGFHSSNEQCDNGMNGNDGCMDCLVTCGWECQRGANANDACNVVCGRTFDTCVLNCTDNSTEYRDTCSTTCGDGKKTSIEECDDGNQNNSDGCNSQCEIEVGWRCTSIQAGPHCTTSECKTVCSDGIRTTDEECDDGNIVSWDGCSPTCKNEIEYGGAVARVSGSGSCACQSLTLAIMGTISYTRVPNTNAGGCEWLIDSTSTIRIEFIALKYSNTTSLRIERCRDPTCRNPEILTRYPNRECENGQLGQNGLCVYTSDTGFMRISYKEDVYYQDHAQHFTIDWRLFNKISLRAIDTPIATQCSSNVTSGLYYNVGCRQYAEETPFSWNAFCTADQTCSKCPCECASSCRVPTYNATVTCQGGCPCDSGGVSSGEFVGYVDDGPGFGPTSLDESRPHQGFRCAWLISSLAVIEFAINSVDVFMDVERYPITQSLEVTLVIQTCRDITCRFPKTIMSYTHSHDIQPLPSVNCTTGFMRIIIQSNMEWYNVAQRQYAVNGYTGTWRLTETPSSLEVFDDQSCPDNIITSGLFGNVGCVQYSNATLNNWNTYCQLDNNVYQTCSRCPCACGCPVCGNGKMEALERCDDGNQLSNDGCSSSCVVECGYHCVNGTHSCVTLCGDSLKSANEACDDGNIVPGDGCDSMCKIEIGYACTHNESCSKSTCQEVCGDANQTRNEQCDDGNKASGDGCSGSCALECGYVCNGISCSTTCGDGILAGNEYCDDGNQKDGDGCSHNCHIEFGEQCSSVTCAKSTCTVVCGDGVLIQGKEDCDDGNHNSGDGCNATCNVEVATVTYSERILIPIWSRDERGLSFSSYRIGPNVLSGAVDVRSIKFETFCLWTIQSTRKLQLRITSAVMIQQDRLFVITNTANYDSCPPDLLCVEKIDGFDTHVICDKCSMYQQVKKGVHIHDVVPLLPLQLLSDEGIIQVGYISSSFGQAESIESDVDYNRFFNFEWTEVENTVAAPSAFQIIHLKNPAPIVVQLPAATTAVRYSDLKFGSYETPSVRSSQSYTYDRTGRSGTVKCFNVLAHSVLSFTLQSPNHLRVRISRLELGLIDSIHITTTRHNHELCPPNNWCGLDKEKQCAQCTSYFQWAKTGQALTLPMEISSDEGAVQIVVRIQTVQIPRFLEFEWNEIQDIPVVHSTMRLFDTCKYLSNPRLPAHLFEYPAQTCDDFYSNPNNALYCIDENACDICGCFCGCICLPNGCEDATTTNNRRLLKSGNSLPIHPRMPILELDIRTRTGIFLSRPISSITNLEYLHSSSPDYRRTSFSIISDTIEDEIRVRSAMSIDSVLSILNAASNNTVILRNIVTMSNIIQETTFPNLTTSNTAPQPPPPQPGGGGPPSGSPEGLWATVTTTPSPTTSTNAPQAPGGGATTPSHTTSTNAPEALHLKDSGGAEGLNGSLGGGSTATTAPQAPPSSGSPEGLWAGPFGGGTTATNTPTTAITSSTTTESPKTDEPLDQMLYKIKISFETNLDISGVDMETKEQIRNYTAIILEIDIARISVWEIFEEPNPSRRLLASRVQFTVSSQSLIESQRVKNAMSVASINTILITYFNHTIIATNMGVSSSYNPADTSNSILSTNVIIFIVVGGIVFVVVILCVCVVCVIRKSIPKEKIRVRQGEFDILICDYCECISDPNIL